MLALQGLLEDSEQRNKQLEQDLLSARKQILELQSPSKPQLKTDQKDADRTNKLESPLAKYKLEIATLKQDSENKDGEIEKLKKFLNKARTIIEDLKKASATQGSVDVQAKVMEKDQIIERMEREMEQKSILREREEKLIVTAWYEMGMQISKKFADQRITTGPSLLSQQRQALAQRMGVSTSLQPPSLR